MSNVKSGLSQKTLECTDQREVLPATVQLAANHWPSVALDQLCRGVYNIDAMLVRRTLMPFETFVAAPHGQKSV